MIYCKGNKIPKVGYLVPWFKHYQHESINIRYDHQYYVKNIFHCVGDKSAGSGILFCVGHDAQDMVSCPPGSQDAQGAV